MMNKGVLVGSGGSEMSPEREKYIPNEAAKLERVVTELEECFGNLQGRLQSVRSEGTIIDKERAERPKELGLPCPLAEHLRQQSARIRNVCERIEYNLSVLET